MRTKSFFLFIFIFQNTGAQSDEVCGEVALTYFLRENRIAARLTFVPSTKLASYRWIHFFIENGPRPDFDFQDALRINSSKYEKDNFSIIIKDLQESDNGVYYIECENVNGRHLFSGKVTIKKPYTSDSVPNHFDKVKPESDLKPTTENCKVCNTKTETEGISTTDKVHITQTDSTTKEETADISVTEIRQNAITEEIKFGKEQKLLTKESILLASGCTIVGVLLSLAVVFVVKKIASHKRKSNEGVNIIMTDGHDLTTMGEQTKENVYCTVIDESKREFRTDKRPSTQDPYSTLNFTNASNENEYSELEGQPAKNEYI